MKLLITLLFSLAMTAGISLLTMFPSLIWSGIAWVAINVLILAGAKLTLVGFWTIFGTVFKILALVVGSITFVVSFLFGLAKF